MRGVWSSFSLTERSLHPLYLHGSGGCIMKAQVYVAYALSGKNKTV